MLLLCHLSLSTKALMFNLKITNLWSIKTPFVVPVVENTVAGTVNWRKLNLPDKNQYYGFFQPDCQWEKIHRRCRPSNAFALGYPRPGESYRNKIWLRHGPVRRLHSTYEWHTGA